MIDGLLDHVETHLGPIVGEWDVDPAGTELPFRIVHYEGKAPPGTEIFSTLGLSDYELSDTGARIELIMIAPARLTAGTIPPILVSAGELPIEVDGVPSVGDTFRSIDALREVSPMDCLYVGRPLYLPPELNPFDSGRRRGAVPVADPGVRAGGRFRRRRGVGGVRATDVGSRRRPDRLHPRPVD